MPGTYTDSYRTIEAKTAAYAILDKDFGKILTTRGAGASVTFTLPNTAGLNPGWFVDIYQCADWAMVIVPFNTAVAAMVTKNNLAAVSLTIDQAGELIGNGFRLVWDGTCWLVYMFTEETVTVTVA